MADDKTTVVDYWSIEEFCKTADAKTSELQQATEQMSKLGRDIAASWMGDASMPLSEAFQKRGYDALQQANYLAADLKKIKDLVENYKTADKKAKAEADAAADALKVEIPAWADDIV